MQNWPEYRKWIIFFIVLFVVLGIATPVLADYLGPNRTVTQTTTTCQFVEYECKFVPSKNDYRYKRVGSASCGSEDKPWKDSPGDGGDCSASTVGDSYWSQVETQQEVTTIYPSAVISSSLQNCTLQNGWCGVTAPDLFLSASEPVAGYNILLIEGTRNGEIFACPSGAASCDLSLLEGNNTFAYWALSSWGDSSEMGMSSILVDTVSPDLSLAISGSSGANGWYISPTTITAVGADATSGLFSALLSANGGTWQPSTTLNEGVYEIAATASDFAGNISNASATISIDTTTPSISAAIQGTTGDNGWYRSVIQVSATATDATSGVATFGASADGSPYQSYTTPISFSDGHHTIQFKAIDRAGNITETPLQEFYIDTVAPTIRLPSSWQLGSNVPYDVNDDGSGLASLRLVIEDEDERYAKVAWNESVSGEAYSGDIHWNGSFKDKTIAPPGTYLVWLKSTDIAGNERIKLGKVIVPEPNVFLSMIQPEDHLTETPLPPDDLYDAGEHRPSIPSSTLDFGGSTTEVTETTAQSLFLTSGTAATIPSTSSNVLWGAAAAAVISSATAYALAGRRAREEAQAKQEAQAAKERDREARKRKRKQQKQQANWIQQQALEQARLLEERKQQAVSNARMETKMARLNAEDEAKWTASQMVNQKREEERKRATEEEKRKIEKQYTGLEAYRDSEKHSESSVVAAPKEKPWWEKALDWVDNHQTEIALGIGIVAGVGAVILTGGLALPLVATAALVAGSAAAAAGTVAIGTVALNLHYGREWHENLLKNVVIAGGAAAVVSTAGFVFQAAATGISSYCGMHTSTCARVEPVFNAIDKVEEIWLKAKLAYQTWRGDEVGAADTLFDLQTEYGDGGMPGNAVAKELGDELTDLSKNAVPVIKKYGNDVVPLLVKYGDEGLALIQRFGDDGIDLLIKHGNDATDLIVLDDDVLQYVLQQGDDAVAALSRWSKDELQAHGPELALRAKKDAEVLASIKKLTSSGPIDPKNLTEEQRALVEAIAAKSTQYADGGQVVLGKWVDISNGFVQTAQDTGSVHYNPHPDMWTMLGKLGDAKQEEVAWLINKQVVQNGIAKGLPFEYTLNGIPSKKILDEGNAVEAIFAGATDAEIMDILQVKSVPIRMKELKELHSAGYQYTFDETTNSYILMLP